MHITKKANGKMVYNAFVAGATEVISHRQELNRINVFPVEDGDTGSNLSATLSGIMEELKDSESVGLVMQSAADGALTSARGNSGNIFAQLIYGFYLEVKDLQEMDHVQFVNAMKTSSNRLKQVISNPVEGTIITVVHTWVNALEAKIHQTTDLDKLVVESLKDCEVALLETPNQMPLLKAKKVVDSGAKGFYHFLKGMATFIQTGELKTLEVKMDLEPIKNVHSTEPEHLTFRYCCEVLIKSAHGAIDMTTLKVSIEALGDSLIVVGGHDRVRVHCHVDEPEQLFKTLSEFGKLSGIKADDMRLQSEVIHHRKNRVALVTDSIADLPQGFIEDHQLFVVPLQLDLDDEAHLDRLSISSKRFYELNPSLKRQPTSSLPTIKSVETLYNFLLEHYDELLVLTVSSHMSGTWGLFESVAKLFRSDHKHIEVIDSKLNSAAQGLVIKQVAELASRGATLEELAKEAKQLIGRTKILVAVDTAAYLARSGRVSRNAGKIIDWLRLKPIMTIDAAGKGKAYGGAVSFDNVMKKVIKGVEAEHKAHGIEEFAIVHADVPDRAEKAARQLEKALGIKVSYISEISAIVGAVAGEGAVGVAFVLKEVQA